MHVFSTTRPQAAEIVSLIDFACAGNPRGRRPEGSIALLPSGLPSALVSAASSGDFLLFKLHFM
ncbi:MAG: hypothetical protein A3C55_06120 [Gammaproteobacteria bacterium RIFCSPHIGHO2_02_FULL_42_13]|nr:MAG: hypothetical protein A3C55_06120 [Gammaproteobacteria bacterium RIFCSPHIGHO2_02_FULL_42_13]OGT67725.1 MAG: hypothetical protein A3H43_04450 [Gammaproteobacteria bacterium RIFCSPLOWO2_02_FULL_42_9]